ncbi:MAG: sigma-70 family RNA polymerase sigma factor [Verrucomicrobia bacterium]|nr:sigma-70 family RNA polymerase sigma factor [Verrucomicrobiota bacterium]
MTDTFRPYDAPGRFPTTHQSDVQRAGAGSSSSARQAFGRFYEAYRAPLLAYLRREGRSEAEAQDLLHGFMEVLLENRSLSQFDGEGRFRSWLLKCFRHFLSDVRDRQRALKRGGAAAHVPLDLELHDAPASASQAGRTPVQEYERQFALRFLERVMGRLREEWHARGHAARYEELHVFLLDKQAGPLHAELGRRLQMTEAAVSQEISRLRKRYRALFDDELARLVSRPEDLAAEKAFLLSALRT